MSDLISRSELLKSFEKSYCGHLGMENSDGMMTFRSIFRIIKEQPTAYDIDKVVEELELHSFELGTDTLPVHYVRLNEAIEIVKQGGVSDDVCEWRIVDIPHNLPIYNTSCGKIRLQYATGIDIYCNGCGKKIKVV